MFWSTGFTQFVAANGTHQKTTAESEESNRGGLNYEGVSASGFKLELKLFYNFLIVYCRCVYFIFLQQVMEQEYILA